LDFRKEHINTFNINITF